MCDKIEAAAVLYTRCIVLKSFFVVLPAFLLVGGLFAVEKPYATGKIVGVEDKVNTKILYYQVDTPITRDDPYYEVSVQLKDIIYLCVYTPRHAKELLPPEWMPGADVKVKLEEKRMILLTPAGQELEMPIAKRTVVKTVEPAVTPPAGK
jgi:hypothetical protein